MSEPSNFIISEVLQGGYSKSKIDRVVNYVNSDVERMGELMNCFFGADTRVSQLAAGSICYVAEKYPMLVEPYLEKMLLLSREPGIHNAIQRNTMRILRDLKEIPASIEGLAADTAFNFLENPNVAVAVRAFSMRVLFKISKKEPDLQKELKLIIENFLPNETLPGFTSTAKDILKLIDKENSIKNKM